MALPKWLAKINRRWVNPKAIKSGTWPVLEHVGRRSGNVYRTPLDAYEIEDGFLFTVNYGSSSDWPRNVMAAGSAVLEVEGLRHALVDPRMVPVKEGYGLLDRNAKTPPSFVGVEQCLLVSLADSSNSMADRARQSHSSGRVPRPR
ncbi:MAG: nitroreductase family deazaflavin-dependent oxidoreductase [Actinobacteria bacterium]|nr:MAG: nitroreductase family deazaflavin-dependent oxidoreductase [Actinomycetota bacterium]